MSGILGKKILIAIPLGMIAEVDRVAAEEHRTRSDLVRESLRRYLESFKRNVSAPQT